MKKIYLFLLLSFFLQKANAQWVTIPDPNFVTFLQQNYPACMNGNQMDTQCGDIVNETVLNCSNKNISDLTGIEYFNNLESLYCNNNNLTFLAQLPNNLIELNCSFNQLTSLPSLPGNLITLGCWNNSLTSLPSLPSVLFDLYANNNQLTSLPSLPSSLAGLLCHSNLLTSLPPLPNSLWQLNCRDNFITSLPALPNSLYSLTCFNNQLTSLPTLPGTLVELHCSENQITTLPSLPNNLWMLNCGNNQLSTLPVLPNSLTELYCHVNNLSALPTLPGNLYKLDCSYNTLNNLPQLPNSLNTLWCHSINITSLPSLPPSLYSLSCNWNQLSTLPALPGTLQILSCAGNQLTSLPNFPSSLTQLYCFGNLLSNLPPLPNQMHTLYCNDNLNLSCLPLLNDNLSDLDFTNTAVQCLPNYGSVTNSNPPLSSLPLCDLFNPNGCDVYWNISGNVYKDNNANCINDTNEPNLGNLKLQLFQNNNLIQQTYSGGEGLYSFDTDTATFTYTVDTSGLPVYVTCPPSGYHTSVLTPADSMDYNMDFGMQCKPGFDVGINNITRSSGQFFPGNSAIIKIGAGDMANFYGMNCANGVSGSVIVDFAGPISFVSAATGALVPVVNGNILTYAIADFGLVNFNSDFRFIVQTDTFAQAGNPVCFTVNVTPTSGDNDISNNLLQHCFTVVNSFDPNAKEVYPQGGIISSQEWMTYTVHFQNTGTAPAQHIYILDTLDNNLDVSSFTLLSYSHEPLTQIFDKVVKFNFPNINLPDSTNDEPNSHGFVQYKVKLVQGLPVGTIISNTAYNFFDFNPPVATNTVSNIVGVTAVANFSYKIGFSVFPNPASSEVTIQFYSEKETTFSLKIYDVHGRVLLGENSVARKGVNELNADVELLRKGIYMVEIITKNDRMMKKLLVN